MRPLELELAGISLLASSSARMHVTSLPVQAPQDLGSGTEGSGCLCSYDQWSLLHILPTRWSYSHRVCICAEQMGSNVSCLYHEILREESI